MSEALGRSPAASVAKVPFRLGDLYALETTSQPAVSADGKRVAFVVQGYRKKENDRYSSLWVASTDGSAPPHRLTRGFTNESSPAWSLDGRYLAFLSTRENEMEVAVAAAEEEEAQEKEAKEKATAPAAPKPPKPDDDKPKAQLWVLDLAFGGEPRQLTKRDEGVSELAWSPDGASLVFVSRDPTPEQQEYLSAIRGRGKTKDKGPLVIDRVQHKYDGQGYLDDVRTHLFVVDLATRAVRRLSDGPCSEAGPRWSPDGKWIVFVSNRTGDPDNNRRADLWLLSPDGKETRRLTFGDVRADAPRWSPDSRHVAFVSSREPENYYVITRLLCVPVEAAEPVADLAACVGVGWSSVGGVVPDLAAGPGAGGPAGLAGHARVYPVPLRPTPARDLTEGLDRDIMGEPLWVGPRDLLIEVGDRGQTRLAAASLDGPAAVVFPAKDRMGEIYTAAAAGGTATAAGGTVVIDLGRPESGRNLYGLAAADLVSDVRDPKLTRLTGFNDDLLAGRLTARYERIEFRSPDGDAVEAVVALPPGFDPAKGGQKPPPVLVFIHGGPMSYDSVGFRFDEQYWSGRGYAVLMVNYRGSLSYGEKFCQSIRGDWGPREHEDVMGGVDELIRRGWGDPERLFCTGFSQGGIMTNWAVGHTDRFRAAVSEHGMWDYVAAYGTDDCHLWWQDDLGVPWQNPDQYRRISPASGVANIRTPLLITAGEVDWRCPLNQAEQLYLALKKRGVPTELVIYQGEHHAITRPRRAIDRLRRVCGWLARYGGLPFEDDSAEGYPDPGPAAKADKAANADKSD